MLRLLTESTTLWENSDLGFPIGIPLRGIARNCADGIACNSFWIARNYPELRGVYRACNCAQLKFTCVGNPTPTILQLYSNSLYFEYSECKLQLLRVYYFRRTLRLNSIFLPQIDLEESREKREIGSKSDGENYIHADRRTPLPPSPLSFTCQKNIFLKI